MQVDGYLAQDKFSDTIFNVLLKRPLHDRDCEVREML